MYGNTYPIFLILEVMTASNRIAIQSPLPTVDEKRMNKLPTRSLFYKFFQFLTRKFSITHIGYSTENVCQHISHLP